MPDTALRITCCETCCKKAGIPSISGIALCIMVS